MIYWCSDLKRTPQNDNVNANVFFLSCAGLFNSAWRSYFFERKQLSLTGHPCSNLGEVGANKLIWTFDYWSFMCLSSALDSSCFMWLYGNSFKQIVLDHEIVLHRAIFQVEAAFFNWPPMFEFRGWGGLGLINWLGLSTLDLFM